MSDSPNALHDELRALIIDTLMLEDVTPAEIEADAPLFGDGLGLDSIDALELAQAIQKQYGVKTTSDDDANSAIFRSLASLAAHIAANRTA